MTQAKVRMVRRVATIVAALVLGAVLLAGKRPVVIGSPGASSATLATQHADRCAGGTAVSAFVCRNSWMAQTRNAAR